MIYVGYKPALVESFIFPSIVYVFPDPVWPYANMVHLYPCKHFMTMGAATWLYIISWLVFSSNTWSKVNSLGILDFDSCAGICTSVVEHRNTAIKPNLDKRTNMSMKGELTSRIPYFIEQQWSTSKHDNNRSDHMIGIWIPGMSPAIFLLRGYDELNM